MIDLTRRGFLSILAAAPVAGAAAAQAPARFASGGVRLGEPALFGEFASDLVGFPGMIERANPVGVAGPVSVVVNGSTLSSAPIIGRTFVGLDVGPEAGTPQPRGLSFAGI